MKCAICEKPAGDSAVELCCEKALYHTDCLQYTASAENTVTCPLCHNKVCAPVVLSNVLPAGLYPPLTVVKALASDFTGVDHIFIELADSDALIASVKALESGTPLTIYGECPASLLSDLEKNRKRKRPSPFLCTDILTTLPAKRQQSRHLHRVVDLGTKLTAAQVAAPCDECVGLQYRLTHLKKRLVAAEAKVDSLEIERQTKEHGGRLPESKKRKVAMKPAYQSGDVYCPSPAHEVFARFLASN